MPYSSFFDKNPTYGFSKNSPDFSDYGAKFQTSYGKDLPSGVDPYGFSKYAKSSNTGTNWGDVLTKGASFLSDYLNRRGSDFGSYNYGGIDSGRRGGMEKIGDLTAIWPDQPGPIVIPGQGEGRSPVAGGISGAMQGAALGAPFGPIAAAAGGVLGGIGGWLGA